MGLSVGAVTQLPWPLTNIRHRHALEFAREVAGFLRSSSEAAAEQGRPNWAAVRQSYDRDTANAERAETRLNAMASKEREKEQSQHEQRRELHLANPIPAEDIPRNLNGETVPIPNNRRNAQPDMSAPDNDSDAPVNPQESGNNPQGNDNVSSCRQDRPDRVVTTLATDVGGATSAPGHAHLVTAAEPIVAARDRLIDKITVVADQVTTAATVAKTVVATVAHPMLQLNGDHRTGIPITLLTEEMQSILERVYMKS